MAVQELWRGGITINEEPNGTYTVRVHERWEHGESKAVVCYSDLSWGEVVTLVYAASRDFTESRRERWRTVLAVSPDQLQLRMD